MILHAKTMTLIIATKTITAVYGTMALQLIEAFQCSVTYSINKQARFFDCRNAVIVCDCSLTDFGTKIRILSGKVGVESRINLQLTGKISFKFNFTSSLLVEYGREILFE